MYNDDVELDPALLYNLKIYANGVYDKMINLVHNNKDGVPFQEKQRQVLLDAITSVWRRGRASVYKTGQIP